MPQSVIAVTAAWRVAKYMSALQTPEHEHDDVD
jgi:hypothetical protein